MIIRLSNIQPSNGSRPGRPLMQRNQGGMAVIVVMAFIAIVLIYISVNIRTLNALGGELKWLEQTQIQRLKADRPSLSTNSVSPVRTTK